MKVFISSVISGFEEMRDAARRGIKTLGQEVIEAEDFSASPRSPQRACLKEARDADAVVLLLGAAYGVPQRSKLSATHEEYLAVRDDDKVLVFVETDVEREPAAAGFLAEVQGWEQGHLTETISHQRRSGCACRSGTPPIRGVACDWHSGRGPSASPGQ